MPGAIIASSVLKYKYTHFDYAGTPQYVDCGTLIATGDRASPISLVLWGKWGSRFGVTSAICSKADVALQKGIYLAVMDDGSPYFELRSSSTNALGALGAANLVDTLRWHHLVVTYNGSSLVSGVVMYVDGVAITSSAVSDNLNAAITNTASFKIGYRLTDPPPAPQDLMDVAFYNKALTPAEVTGLYNARCPVNLKQTAPVNNNQAYYLLGAHIGDPSLSIYAVDYPFVPDASGRVHPGTMIGMSPASIRTRT